jgi:hypothetical protein
MRRFAGLAVVLVLHIAVIAIFLRATPGSRPRQISLPETILWLAQSPPTEEIATKHMAAPALYIPHYADIPANKSGDSSDSLTNLHTLLFDCRTDNLVNLTAEERSRCERATIGMTPNGSVDYTDRTYRSHDAALWARGRARKNAPLLLPCANAQSAFATASAATILCLADKALNGLDRDSDPIYGERPQESHLPNNGDPPPTYRGADH